MPLHRLRARPDPLLQLRFLIGFPREIRAIRKLIRQQSIDIVLVCGLVNPHAAIAARLEGVPVVWQLVDTRPPMALRRLIMPLVTRLSDVIMTTGMAVARVHPGATSLGTRLVPFFPPVDTTSYHPDSERRTAARQELAVGDDSCVIGTVGNLNPQKGHEYLLRAAALIRRTRPHVAVRVLGAHTPTQSAYEHGLREEAQGLGLADPATLAFVDPGARVAELLPAFDVFLLTAVPRSEGIPTVILEAMACGIPVVTTDVGAVREVVEDGVTGFIVPALNPQAIAEATLRLLGDEQQCSRMGVVARQHAVERYDIEVCADVHVRAFEAAAAHRRGRRRA
jgi:glycosyltransferase involved in cell wall biosynthesis